MIKENLDCSALAAAMKEARETAGLSATQVSDVTGYSVGELGKIENGKKDVCTMQFGTVISLCRFYGISIDRFFDLPQNKIQKALDWQKYLIKCCDYIVRDEPLCDFIIKYKTITSESSWEWKEAWNNIILRAGVLYQEIKTAGVEKAVYDYIPQYIKVKRLGSNSFEMAALNPFCSCYNSDTNKDF